MDIGELLNTNFQVKLIVVIWRAITISLLDWWHVKTGWSIHGALDHIFLTVGSLRPWIRPVAVFPAPECVIRLHVHGRLNSYQFLDLWGKKYCSGGRPSGSLWNPAPRQESKEKQYSKLEGIVEISANLTDLKDSGVIVSIYLSLVYRFGPYKARLTLEDKGTLSQTQPRSNSNYSHYARCGIFASTD